MESVTIGVTVWFFVCGFAVLVGCRRCVNPLRAVFFSALGGLAALGGCSLAGGLLPVNFWTVGVSLLLGAPGAAGLAAFSFL